MKKDKPKNDDDRVMTILGPIHADSIKRLNMEVAPAEGFPGSEVKVLRPRRDDGEKK
jgi:RNA binding exosome subunit